MSWVTFLATLMRSEGPKIPMWLSLAAVGKGLGFELAPARLRSCLQHGGWGLRKLDYLLRISLPAQGSTASGYEAVLQSTEDPEW
jgi:hypothetical protein